ncbi:MAG: polysaccharide deacetylase [Oscillospiraceae bacterium]|jgi:peptidoglycan/xylan/chitin deacetylase (PgdA/CDA1 family)|nr:polysaccharide deacetylase [Oscillospiraceae bacterium]
MDEGRFQKTLWKKIGLIAGLFLLLSGCSASVQPYWLSPGNGRPASSAGSSCCSSQAVQPSSRPAVSAASSESSSSSCPVHRQIKDKTVFLTFDDGPSDLTVPLLDVLDRYDVKATFFVVGTHDKNEVSDLKEIVKRGHAVGVHSYTHDYHQIYASSKAFFEDFDKMHSLIQRATKVDTKICRLAGGSLNGYNQKTRAEIIAGLNERGYVYYDWNVSAEDARKGATPKKILKNTLDGIHSHHVSVALLHNSSTKKDTLKEVPTLIQTLKKEGYSFETLDPSVNNRPFIFYHAADASSAGSR